MHQAAFDEGVTALGGSSRCPQETLRDSTLPTSGLQDPTKPNQQSLVTILTALENTGWKLEGEPPIEIMSLSSTASFYVQADPFR